jgi:hypothetical protein
VRFIGPLLLVVLSTFVMLILLVAPESCVLAERDPGDDSGDVTAPPPPPVEAEVFDILDECVCCGKTILPLSPDCSGEVAFAIVAADCPKDCKGKVAYVLCKGVCYSDCACDLPSGFSLVDGGS